MAKDFNIENEMSSLSKTVANLSKENPFSLPSTYFSEFPARILQKIENEFIKINDLEIIIDFILSNLDIASAIEYLLNVEKFKEGSDL